MSKVAAAFGARAHAAPFVARLLVGGVFLAAGLLKVDHPADFAATITSLQLGIPGRLVAMTAVALPAFEVLLGVYLIGGWQLRVSSGAAILLLLVFVGVIASAVVRGINASCGCFGAAAAEKASWLVVGRDALLLVPAAYLHWWAHVRGAPQKYFCRIGKDY